MRVLIFSLIVFLSCSAYAQNKETLYDFTDVPQSLMLNPGAKVNFKKHLGVPLLSQIHINIGFSGASAYDIFADDGRDINVKIKETLDKLKSTDYFSLTQQLELINFGWRSKRTNTTYYSGGIYQELDLMLYFPRDLALLAYKGNQNFIDETFRLSSINATGELMTVYHFGINKRLSKKLTIGGRAKIYASMFNFRSVKNRGALTTINTPNGKNIYQHLLSNVDVSFETAGFASLRDLESEDIADGASQVLKKMIRRSLLGGNLGLGVDVGFNYQVDDQWSITGSINDLGMIFYTKDIESYYVKGDFSFIGFKAPVNDGSSQDLIDQLEDAIDIDSVQTGYNALRPMKLNGSIKYSFNRSGDGACDYCQNGEDTSYLDAFGLQLFSQFRPKRPVYAASLFYYKRIGFLRGKLTYTIDDFSYSNIGFLLSTHIKKFNFYISANNILEYSNVAKANGISVQLGLNIIME